MNAQQLALTYSQSCRDSAQHWLGISDRLQDTDPDIARFALDRAIENYNTAQRWESKQEKQSE